MSYDLSLKVTPIKPTSFAEKKEKSAYFYKNQYQELEKIKNNDEQTSSNTSNEESNHEKKSKFQKVLEVLEKREEEKKHKAPTETEETQTLSAFLGCLSTEEFMKTRVKIK